MNCYCCKKAITKENSSEEHILLNSIGGKLKSYELLCKDCNSKFGDTFDSELSKQMLFLSSFLNIDRDRGNHPILKGAKTQSGEEIYLLSGGKPYFSKPIVETTTRENEIVLNIRARNEQELKQIAKGLKRKYPKIDVDEIINKANHTHAYLNEPIKITQTIGGKDALNAIVKIALNYYIYKTKDYSPVADTIEILKEKTENELCKHFYPKNFYKKESKEICHLVHIQSNKRHKNLLAYVEFFSSYSFVVMLSNNYTGNPINSTYCYDLNHKKISLKKLDLKLSTESFSSFPIISPKYYETITEKMDRIIKMGIEKQNDKEVKSLVSRCVDDILVKKYGHEKVINSQMTQELSSHLATEFVKFMYRDIYN